MHAEYSTLSKAVRSLQQLKPTLEEFDTFKRNLAALISKTEDAPKNSKSGALEETEKGLLKDFLRDSFYGHLHVGNLNYKGNTGADLAIRSAKNNTLVLFECKARNNAAEMVTKEDLLRKAFLEAVAYYCFEKEELKNDHLKHVVITNTREWFVFDAADFRAATHGKTKVREAFTQWNKGNWDNATTASLHKRLAELLAAGDDLLPGYHVDLWAFKKYLDRDDEESRTELLKLYRFLGPGFLLKEGTGKDSNTLNKGFYNELLHIIGLQEVKDGGVKRIKRLPEGRRHTGMLIENAIAMMKSEGTFARLPDKEQYGAKEEDQLFAVAMELSITWLDRILFLKLLEAQLLRYHNGERKYAFLSPTDEGQQYDYLNALFFEVMAKEESERRADVRKQFADIPYLNSTLFVPSELEYATMRISGLSDNLRIPLHTHSILIQKKLAVQELQALDYLLRFLDAYDFGSTPGEVFKDKERSLISASVLGLIFEKLNGYKDGSFYTPGFITMYMCRETLRPAVVHRFNERFNLTLSGFDALKNHCAKLNEHVDIASAEKVIDDLRVCDPAVGSGHFLVSALNELLTIKSELGLLTDADGKPLHKWTVAVANDEITVQDLDDAPFKYQVPAGKPIPAEMQRVQRALFEQKRKLIEGCLFGVDINPNSVKICRLRLWIELLKSAYYLKPDGKDLKTLPNIDINIKRGNSLFSRYALTENIEAIMRKTTYTADQYRGFVQDYKEATSREMREGIETILQGIEGQFNAFSQARDPRMAKRSVLAKELDTLTGGLFGGGAGYKNEAAKKKAEKRVTQLEKEINAVSADIARESGGRAYQGAFEWRYAFPEVLDADGAFRGFDVVLGNPPYIRQEELGDFKDFLQRNYAETFASTADLFIYFIQLGHKLLAKNGWFCYIVANKWMRAGYGEKLRAWLGGRTLVQLIDFGDLPVFEEATTYPCIMLTNASEPKKDHKVQALSMPELHADDLHAFVHANAMALPQAELVRNNYRIAAGGENAVLEKIRNAGVPLGEYLQGEMYRGVLSGYNDAFVIDEETKNQLIKADSRSEEVIKPFLVGKEIKRYQPVAPKRYLLFIPWHFPLHKDNSIHGASTTAELAFEEQYPAVYKHLLQHRAGLNARNKAETGIRYEWYALQRCAATYFELLDGPKLVWAEIAGKGEFTLDNTGGYLDTTAFMMPRHDLWLLGILNSTLFTYMFSKVSSSIQGGFFRWKKIYMEQIPMVEPSATAKQQLEGLVTQRLGLEAGSAAAKAVETEMDTVVYGVYGLSEEEVTVVEGNSNK
jgi:hypothetical protein